MSVAGKYSDSESGEAVGGLRDASKDASEFCVIGGGWKEGMPLAIRRWMKLKRPLYGGSIETSVC